MVVLPPRLVISVIVAASAALSACTSGSANEESSATTTTAVEPISPTPLPSPTNRILRKKIGERAGVGCPDQPGAPCDIEFAITAIQPNVQCEDPYGTPIGPDEQMLRFDVEVWTRENFTYPDVDSALFLKNWGVGDAEGVDTNLRDHTAIRCGGELTGDQISQFLLPGAHFTKSIFVTAPKDSTILRLYNEPSNSWIWEIPPA